MVPSPGAVDKKIQGAIDRRGRFLNGLFLDSSPCGGKHLRALLLLDFAGSCNDRAVSAAASIELLHMATLIHDDILDSALLRRGRPALYKRWGPHKSVLYGDYLFSKSFSLAFGTGNRKIYGEITQVLSSVLRGEMEEQFRRMDISLTKKDYLSIIRDKTGELFGAACKIGAMVAGRSERFAEKARRFGLRLGTAYQILDDCNDYFSESTGKKPFNDLKEGVITLPLIYLLERSSKNEKSRIAGILKNRKASFLDFRKIARMMKRCGAISDCCDDGRAEIEGAERALEYGKGSSSCRRREVASWIRERLGRVEEEYSHSGRGVRGH